MGLLGIFGLLLGGSALAMLEVRHRKRVAALK
jgi:hypothetical protein